MDGFRGFVVDIKQQFQMLLQIILNWQYVRWIVDYYLKLTNDRNIDDDATADSVAAAAIGAGAGADVQQPNTNTNNIPRIKWSCGVTEDADRPGANAAYVTDAGDAGDAVSSEAPKSAAAEAVTHAVDTKCPRKAASDIVGFDQEQQLPNKPVTETVTDVGLAGVLNAIPRENMGKVHSSNKNKQKANKNSAGGEVC